MSSERSGMEIGWNREAIEARDRAEEQYERGFSGEPLGDGEASTEPYEQRVRDQEALQLAMKEWDRNSLWGEKTARGKGLAVEARSDEQQMMRAALRDILRAGGIDGEASAEALAAEREANARLLAAGQRWAAEVAEQVNDREADGDLRLWNADFLTLVRDLLWSRTNAPAKAEDLDGIAVRIARARELDAQAKAETRVANGITASWARGELDIGEDDGRLDTRLAKRRIDELLSAEHAPVDLYLALNEAIDLGLPDEAAQEMMDAFSDPAGTQNE